MKTLEQKAKAYDEVIGKATALYKASEPMSGCNVILETLFPELKESEDEKVKRILHSISSKISFHLRDIFTEEEFQCFDTWSNAWLQKQGEQEEDILEDVILDGDEDGLIAETIRFKNEKQSEQKSDKVEPKFKVGDWVAQGCNILKIRCVGDKYYCFETVGGYVDNMLVSEIDSLYHLWSIQDAEEGDVLVHNGCTFIFMGIKDGIVQAIEENTGELVNFGEPDKDNDYWPATKEQRDLLFQKMKEAGYEWDAENKQLNKTYIVHDTYCQDNCKGFQETGKCFTDGDCKAKEEAEQKLTESEDEKIRKGLIGILSKYKYYYSKEIAWLKKQDKPSDEEMKTLLHTEYEKGRADAIAEIQKSWSEEDEDTLGWLCTFLKGYGHEFYDGNEEDIADWLKSLKGRVQPKQKWSEEDEENMEKILSAIESYYYLTTDDDVLCNWLKSFKSKNS